MKRTMRAAAALVVGCCSIGVQAQMGAEKAPVAVGQAMDPAKALDEVLTMFESQAMAVAKAMPADKYSFAPSSAAFASGSAAKYEGVRTFAQEVAHVASANYFFYSEVSGMKPDVDVKAVGKLTTKDECVAALQASFAFGHKAVATVTTANAFESIKGADGLHTRVTVADFAVAHGFDHYGQMVEYMRMNGVVPPGSK
jgi:uncharacterized damage-inducible protein DinB